MKFSVLDVALVALFLTAAIVGGSLGVLSKELVAAIITAAIAFLAARGKALGDKESSDEKKPKKSTKREREDGAPDKPNDAGRSHKIIVGPNGTIKVEDMDTPPSGTPKVDEDEE